MKNLLNKKIKVLVNNDKGLNNVKMESTADDSFGITLFKNINKNEAICIFGKTTFLNM